MTLCSCVCGNKTLRLRRKQDLFITQSKWILCQNVTTPQPCNNNAGGERDVRFRLCLAGTYNANIKLILS